MNRSPLADQFEWFADWARGTSPLYELLARRVADDAAILELAERVPEDRSPTHLLFASVHSLLLDGVDRGDDGRDGGGIPSLAEYYPTCAGASSTDAEAVDGHELTSARRPDDDAFRLFREFCLAHEDQITARLTTRRTQTNAVRRCAVLLPAFEYVSRRVGGRPLALVEVGPSAGLNLCWDRYAYEYRREDSETTLSCGAVDSPCRIRSTLRGSVDPPLPASASESASASALASASASADSTASSTEFPPVASRVGVDLNPLDVTDADDVTWLLALVWPEHTDRHALLRDAIAVAREEPPELRAGDALDTLAAVVDEIPAGTPVCLFDTQVRYQLDEAGDERYRNLVRDLGRGREVHWLSGHESVDGEDEALWLTHSTAESGESRADGDTREMTETRLAAYQQHGRWVRWVDGATETVTPTPTG